MTRTIQDDDLQMWEAYASSGDFGFPDHSKMIFQCLSDRTRRARYVERDGSKSEVEKEISRLSDPELVELLTGAAELK